MPTFQVALIHTMPFPNTLPALLSQMQNRLGMYINPPTLPSLMNFISGYTMATRCHHIDEPDILRPSTISLPNSWAMPNPPPVLPT